MLPPDIETRDALRHLSAPADTSRKGMSRRRFLQAAALGAGGVMAGPSLGGILPGFEDHMASAATLGPTEGVLVVVLMAGGNDALNTVIPYGQPAYYAKRGSLAYAANSVWPLVPGVGLVPALGKLKARYNAGKVAIVQGVGVQAQANFSHFESMGMWMNGWAGGGPPSTGWLGRWMDGLPANPFVGLSIDSSVPLHLVGATRKAMTLSTGGPPFGGTPDPSWDLMYKAISDFAVNPTQLGPWGDTIAKNGQESIQTAVQAASRYNFPFPHKSPLGDKLVLAARLINANLGIRVVGVTIGDFDSHANQPSMHPKRMAELDAAIEDFFVTLWPQFQGRTSMLVFSEFGRYPVRNDSNGFDHGWAGNAFVIGDRVAGGMKGTTLDITTTLSNGHIAPTMDFKSVYAGILNDWLGADSTQILGTNVSPLALFNSGPH